MGTNQRNSFKENLIRHHSYDSPVIEMLQISVEFELFNEVQNMFQGTPVSKQRWKSLVWERAWTMESDDWVLKTEHDKHFDLITRAMDGSSYSIWRYIADGDQSKMRQCENMVKLITLSSALKGDDCRLKRLPFGSRMCTRCDLCSLEDANHMIMQCPEQDQHHREMYNEISRLYGLEVGEYTLDICLVNICLIEI